MSNKNEIFEDLFGRITRGTEPAPKGWSAQPVCAAEKENTAHNFLTVTNPKTKFASHEPYQQE